MRITLLCVGTVVRPLPAIVACNRHGQPGPNLHLSAYLKIPSLSPVFYHVAVHLLFLPFYLPLYLSMDWDDDFINDEEEEEAKRFPTMEAFRIRLRAGFAQMMFVSGETAEPSQETTTLIEDIVRQQVIEMVWVCQQLAGGTANNITAKPQHRSSYPPWKSRDLD